MIGEVTMDRGRSYSLGIDLRHLGQSNFKRFGSLIDGRKREL